MKDFDELLDSVLREDSAAEPHVGLEARVIARVRSDERLAHGSVSQFWNGWRRWLFVPGAACLGVLAIWFVADRGGPQPERIAMRVSAPALSADAAMETGTMEGSRNLGGSGHAFYPSQQAGRGPRSRDAHRRPDKAAPKMGHPVLEDARYVDRKVKRVEAASEGEPKLETFPAVSQKGDPAGWLGGGDDGKLAAIAREMTPAAAAAYQQLNAVQNEPIDIAAIEIKPLQ